MRSGETKKIVALIRLECYPTKSDDGTVIEIIKKMEETDEKYFLQIVLVNSLRFISAWC